CSRAFASTALRRTGVRGWEELSYSLKVAMTTGSFVCYCASRRAAASRATARFSRLMPLVSLLSSSRVSWYAAASNSASIIPAVSRTSTSVRGWSFAADLAMLLESLPVLVAPGDGFAQLVDSASDAVHDERQPGSGAGVDVLGLGPLLDRVLHDVARAALVV